MVPVSCLMMLCLTQVTAKAGTTDPTAYDNVVYVEPATVSASSSTEVELDICMNNTAEIRGFQFDLYLPDGMTVVKTSKGKIAASLNEARLPEDDEHKLTVAEQADGAIRFLCASQYDETFTGATGKIITLKVNIGGLAAGEHPMTLKAIKLSESDISKFYEVDEIVTTFTVGSGSTGTDTGNNAIYVAPATVNPADGTEVVLSVCMDNTAEIRGFQFDLYLPEGMTAVKSSKGKIAASLNSDRLPEDDEHTLTVAEQADGAIRFLCGSLYNDTFTGTSGEIATIKVNIGGLADGEYPITLKAVKLTETNISQYYNVPEVVTTLTVSSEAGSTDFADYSNVIYVAPATVNPSEGNEVAISLYMNNAADIRGFQFDLYLPEGMTPLKTTKGKFVVSLNPARLPVDDEHTLTVAEQADGAIRFLCGSQYDETFTGASGEIATIKVNIENLPEGDYPIVLKAIKLTESDVSQYYNVPEIVTTLTVSSDGDQAMAELETTMDNALELYNRIKYRYPGAAFELYNTINSVIDVPGNPSATKTEIEAAITALNDALIQAKNSIITGVDSVKSAADSNGDFIDLSGRQLKGKPSRAGVYFKNGNKIVVK